MTEQRPADVVPHPSSASGNGGGSGDLRRRLRAVEQTAERIEERLKHVPTKAFVLTVLLSLSVGPLTAAVVALAIALLRAN